MVHKEKRRDEARVGVVGRNNITFSHTIGHLLTNCS